MGQVALCPASDLFVFVVSLGRVGVGLSDCFGNGFRSGLSDCIRSGRGQKPHNPRDVNPQPALKKNVRGELNTSMVFAAMREKKCLGKGWMGRWEEVHERVSRGVLETEHGLQKQRKREKMTVGPG